MECSNPDVGHSSVVGRQNDGANVCRECHGNDEEETLAEARENDQLPSKYLEQRIFRLLLPALEETLSEASNWNALRVQKCRFNGLDYIAEILWNNNPSRSKKFSPRLNAFDIPLFKQWLSLRPPYPKSWLWSQEEATLHLQRYVRGWLVRKRADVQEMRQFWKDIAAKNLTRKETTSTVEQQRIRIPGEVQINGDGTMDVDSVRCKKYRWMVYANKASIARTKDTF
ncbi:IQ domain-containing protein K [Colletes latitarsis]|uniref:IQ domain-containing protein K n=1 Tax=Colletes latitarsis TaxID=2605962 RepID=UPI0040356CC1